MAKGYLAMDQLPSSLRLLPPPPDPNSAAYKADEEAYLNTRSLEASPRWAQAVQDADLQISHAAERFSCALGVPITQESTPHLFMLLRRTLTDAGLATYSAKNHYQRTRPFALRNELSCTPADEPGLRMDGSYPSGHATIGWAWALVLAEVAPDRTGPLLARGLSFGESRIICGVHWRSDVDAGRVIGAATVARLHGDPVFRAELEAAKKEVASARSKGMKAARDCPAEAEALK